MESAVTLNAEGVPAITEPVAGVALNQEPSEAAETWNARGVVELALICTDCGGWGPHFELRKIRPAGCGTGTTGVEAGLIATTTW